MASDPKPYRYSVPCAFQHPELTEGEPCGIPAFGWCNVTGPICRTHAEISLVAGGYEGPLPEQDEALKVLREADDGE